MISWLVVLQDGQRFTFITDQCKTTDEVAAAILEKMCKPIAKAERL